MSEDNELELAKKWLSEQPVSLWGRFFALEKSRLHEPAEWFLAQKKSFEEWKARNTELKN